MKCPHAIEPHQIQGGDFIHIFPVVQWLVKRVFERRADIGDFNRAYTLNQYEKQFGERIDPAKDQSIISFKQNVETIRVKSLRKKKRSFNEKNKCLVDSSSTKTQISMSR
jgi:hypothetical protein